MESDAPTHAGRPYVRLLVMTLLSFITMYALMYAMVDTLAEVHPNLNQIYMAGLMAAPHAVFMLVLMRKMYPKKTLNAVIGALAAGALVLCWFGIRTQAGVGDMQFVKSMIPHHSGAILMCREAPIRDAELKALCKQIIASQAAEIRQMEGIANRLSP